MGGHKVWLEVSLNGPWSRERQPLMPVAVRDIVAQGIECVAAGAAIVHVHAYDERTGRQQDEAATYAAIIEGIRAKVDAIVYPTLPFAGSVDASAALTPAQRYAHVEELCRRDLLEWSVVDPGSTQISAYADLPSGKEGFIYANPESHIRHGLALAQAHRYHPGFAIYEPAFLRLGAALASAFAGMPQPIYRFMFSTGFTFGFPPERYALDAYLKLLASEAPGAPWMVAGLDVDISALVPMAVERGGHVRVGLEDAPFGTTTTNRQWVDRAVSAMRAAGAEPATPAEVRAELGARAAT